MHGGKRVGAGRKPVKIDLEQLEKLSTIQCTVEEVAAFFGVSVRMIERRRHGDPDFAVAMDRGYAKGRISVRRELFRQACQGKSAALTLFAKSKLDYRDRGHQPDVAHPGSDGPKYRFKGSLEDLLQLYREITMAADDSEAQSSRRKRNRPRVTTT